MYRAAWPKCWLRLVSSQRTLPCPAALAARWPAWASRWVRASAQVHAAGTRQLCCLPFDSAAPCTLWLWQCFSSETERAAAAFLLTQRFDRLGCQGTDPAGCCAQGDREPRGNEQCSSRPCLPSHGAIWEVSLTAACGLRPHSCTLANAGSALLPGPCVCSCLFTGSSAPPEASGCRPHCPPSFPTTSPPWVRGWARIAVQYAVAPGLRHLAP